MHLSLTLHQNKPAAFRNRITHPRCNITIYATAFLDLDTETETLSSKQQHRRQRHCPQKYFLLRSRWALSRRPPTTTTAVVVRSTPKTNAFPKTRWTSFGWSWPSKEPSWKSGSFGVVAPFGNSRLENVVLFLTTKSSFEWFGNFCRMCGLWTCFCI